MRSNHVAVTTLLVLLCGLAPWPLDARQAPARVPQGPTGTVTLPVDDYDRLVDRAARPVVRTDPPPVAAVVGRAELRARVDGATVRGSLRLDGEVFQRGAVKVPLVTGATLVDARQDGRALPLLPEGPVHAAVFTGPAAFSATLEWVATLEATPGRAAFTLPQAASGSISVAVDLPGDPAGVRIDPGFVTRRQTTAGRTTIEMTVAPGSRPQVSWSVRESGPPRAAESRTLAEVRSLVTLGDGDVRLVSVVDITVIRGEPRTFDVQIPDGYELVEVTGSAIENTEARGGTVTLTVREPSRRRHQFLVSLEQPHSPGSFKLDTMFPAVAGTQRELGEVAVEGLGTMDVHASGDENLRRMDVREVHASLRALARQPLLAAFRYQRRPQDVRSMALDVRRFADASVLAAAAEHATATTLVTSEGRMLTELSLRIRNRAQAFMKVVLPAGATMLSAEVAGETAKPVSGADGTRIPLLRTGFRPDGPYTVSFVYIHAGQAMARKGEAPLALATVDVPVSLLEWELFLPEQYDAKPVAGNVIPASVVQMSWSGDEGAGPERVSESMISFIDNVGPGQIVGRVTDATGASIPGATIVLALDGRPRMTVYSDVNGMYALRGVPSGTLTVTSELAGFVTGRRTFTFDQQPRRLDFQMQVGTLTETVTVQAEVPRVDGRSARIETDPRVEARAQQAPSQNIINMQRRVAGVLPIRVDVPRAGNSYRFFRPLVLNDETTVTFRYKTR